MAKQDMAEELVVSSDGQIKVVGTTLNPNLNPQFTNDDEINEENFEMKNLYSSRQTNNSNN